MYRELGIVFRNCTVGSEMQIWGSKCQLPAIHFAYIVRPYRAATSHVLFTLVMIGRQDNG